MFGQQDDQNQHSDAVQPVSDGTVTNDTATPPMPDVDVNSLSADVPEPLPPSEPQVQPEEPQPQITEPAAPDMPPPSAPVTPVASVNTDQLLDIKQQALQQLSPLVGHLEQDPEEKFRTTMMMIQAADNSSLIQSAYQAAMQITDEKVRAQALLDVVNEINYFTHNSSPDQEA